MGYLIIDVNNDCRTLPYLGLAASLFTCLSEADDTEKYILIIVKFNNFTRQFMLLNLVWVRLIAMNMFSGTAYATHVNVLLVPKIGFYAMCVNYASHQWNNVYIFIFILY